LMELDSIKPAYDDLKMQEDTLTKGYVCQSSQRFCSCLPYV